MHPEVSIVRFMVIERFRNAEAVSAVYQRFLEKGRLMPEGLSYVDSWVEVDFQRCFLLADCDDPQLVQEWILRWHDLLDFEVVPVVSSKQTADVVTPVD